MLNVAQAQGQHAQDHRRQVGALDFRFGKGWPGGIVLLTVQPEAGTRGNPATATAALVRTGLGYRFYGQALHLAAVAVAADAGETGIDHRMDTGNGDRGFGYIGRKNDAPPPADNNASCATNDES